MKTFLATIVLSLLSTMVSGLEGVALGILALCLLICYGVQQHVKQKRDNPDRKYPH